MEAYRNILHRYWPIIALFLAIGLVSFLIWGKLLIGFFAKATVKIVGLVLIGIGLIFQKIKQKNETAH